MHSLGRCHFDAERSTYENEVHLPFVVSGSIPIQSQQKESRRNFEATHGQETVFTNTAAVFVKIVRRVPFPSPSRRRLKA